MQAPVVDGRRHRRFARGLGGTGHHGAVGDGRGDAQRGIVEVVHRFKHAEEHQPDAHAGGEEHGEPADIAEVGHCVRPTDADLADGQDQQRDTEQHEQIARDDEQPIECRGQPYAQPLKCGAYGVAEDKRAYDEPHDHNRRDEKHRVVDIEAENLNIVLARLKSVVSIGLFGNRHLSLLSECVTVRLPNMRCTRRCKS